jgi:hypothetical protein
VDEIRADGAGNVIVVPGLNGEKTLSGMPGLADPANPTDPQIAFGIHYPSLTGGLSAWNRAFGRTAQQEPVIVTEWNANAITNCLPQAPTLAPRLLDYLVLHHIGVVGFALDLPGTIVSDWSGDATTYTGFACGNPADGPGQLLFSDFAAEARAESNSTPALPSAWILSAGALRRLEAEGGPSVSAVLDTPLTYVTGAGSGTLGALSTPTAVPTMSFRNEATLAAAINRGSLRTGTAAVVLQLGNSAQTPRAEQRDPGRYYRAAAGVAHAHGLALIAAPSLGLVKALSPRTPPALRPQAFLRLGVPALAARYADVYANAILIGAAAAAEAAQAARANPAVARVGFVNEALTNSIR